MSALDFPNSPTVGQTFAPGGAALSYMWDGTRWRIAGGLGSPSGCVGYGSTVNATGSITSAYVDIGGLSVTFNAVAGRLYRAIVNGLMLSSVNGDLADLVLTLDGGQVAGSQTVVPVTGTENVLVTALMTPSTGTHTVKLMAKRGAGTGTLMFYATVAYPAWLSVEDITYQPGGGGGTAVGQGFLALPKLLDQDQAIGTSNTSITGASITFNAVLGRIYEASWVIQAQQSVAVGQQTLRLNLSTGPHQVSFADVPSGAYLVYDGVHHFVGGPAIGNLPGVPAGSQTISMSGWTTAGAMNIKHATITNGRFAVKDIGPSS